MTKSKDICILLLILVFWLSPLRAEDSTFRELVNCKEHWAKLEVVAVYKAPDAASEVIEKIKRPEKVCVIGERADFYILDWSKQNEINGRRLAKKSEYDIAYARKVDLVQALEKDEDIWSRAQRQLNLMRNGVVPDDIYGPFRPLIESIHPSTRCRAGKEICEKVEAELSDEEEGDTE